jgi:hypothetical protein
MDPSSLMLRRRLLVLPFGLSVGLVIGAACSLPSSSRQGPENGADAIVPIDEISSIDANGEEAGDATADATPDATESAIDAPPDLARDITWIDADPSCSAFCACMSKTCVSEKSYPFPDVPSCESWCSKRSDLERTCFARFCQEAEATKGPEIKTHDCEHASGAWGLLECM